MLKDPRLIKVLQEELDRVTDILSKETLAPIEHRASLSMYRVQLAEKLCKYSQPGLEDLGGPALEDQSSAVSARS